jgi:Tfp pilus assembly protein PilO
MMVYDQVRGRIVRYALLGALLGGAGWGVLGGLPKVRAAQHMGAEIARLERGTLRARDEAVRMGGTAMEDSIAAAKARFEALQDRVPGGSGGMSPAEIRQVIAGLAEREGVVVRQVEPIAPAREGGFEVSGVRVRLVGSYHALGTWMSGVLSVPRLVQLRGVAMRVEPDSLRASARADGDEAAPAPAAPHGVEEPGAIVGDVAVVWFRQAPGSPVQAADSTVDPGR